MYAQRLLLSLAARGIGSIPQTSLGFFADVVREVLGVSAEFKLLIPRRRIQRKHRTPGPRTADRQRYAPPLMAGCV